MCIVFEPLNDGTLGFVYMQTVKEVTVNRRAIFNVGLARKAGGGFNCSHNIDAKGCCEVPVPLILTGNTHYCSGAVTHQDIIRDKDGYFFPIDRYHAVRAEVHPCF